MSAQRFAVEVNRRVVGIAVRVPGGFMFFSSEPKFDKLDGHTFPRARAMARRLAEFTSNAAAAVTARRGVPSPLRS